MILSCSFGRGINYHIPGLLHFHGLVWWTPELLLQSELDQRRNRRLNLWSEPEISHYSIWLEELNQQMFYCMFKIHTQLIYRFLHFLVQPYFTMSIFTTTITLLFFNSTYFYFTYSFKIKNHQATNSLKISCPGAIHTMGTTGELSLQKGGLKH